MVRRGYEPFKLLNDEDIGFSTGFTDYFHDLVLDDEARYNYGDDWRQILYLLPEILDSARTPRNPQSLREEK
jgi:hypothetical protein